MSDNSNATGETLVDRLLGNLLESSFDQGREFWPDDCINQLITPEIIADRLADQDDQIPLKALVAFINRDSRKTFAIVLCCNLDAHKLFQAMKLFMRLNFNDSNLPVVGNDVKRIFSSGGRYQYPWNSLAVRCFEAYQWNALAPVFDDRSMELALQRDHIFPFIWSSHRGASGMFGDVYEVAIHPAHWCHKGNVAVKKLHRVFNDDPAEMIEVETEWQKEVQAHKTIAECEHSNIIKFITAITRDHERYLMFEWANGGNLREFWANHSPSLTEPFVEDIFLQLRGLADGLDEIHANKLRHGDMKPENILRFKTPGDDSAIGTLKICDMGLTKYHELATQLREQATETKFTTSRYEPPESAEDNKAWSRRYDTWSMGCIILEFIVWMVYGTEQLDMFNNKIVNEFGKSCHYFEMEKRNGKVSSRVHQAVHEMMDKLAQCPECQMGKTALGDLLELVRTRLLNVRLGQMTLDSGKSTNLDIDTQIRADSATLRRKLDNIIQRGKDDSSYWLKGHGDYDDESQYRTPADEPEHDAPNSATLPQGSYSGNVAESFATDSSGFSFTLTGSSIKKANHPSKTWDLLIDNDFAAKVAKRIGNAASLSKARSSKRVCDDCRELKFWKSHFNIVDSWKKLEEMQSNCDFCRMRLDTCSHLDREKYPSLRFDRDRSSLTLNNEYPPVLSIRRGPETQLSEADHIQIGFTHLQLHEATTQLHFHILRQCLSDCDAQHPECQPQRTATLPTRLMHVGTKKSSVITLYETQPGDEMKYIALSHPWGREDPFCTRQNNIDAHRRAIDFEDLPVMFQDAVETTRELRLEYLWIDSLCIIQGPDGDFATEARKMEDVFNCAYCVVAASSATGPTDSFLNPRSRLRPCVTIEPEDERLPPIHLSRFIDQFENDVLKGPLNKRGWVLQERALARRTIYFTDSQTYWECGEGVRCETMAKMANSESATFPGIVADPNFAVKLANRDMTLCRRIDLCEDFYRRYTRLGLTRATDRPLAIAGLERRLLHCLNVKGGFGLFDDGHKLLPRSLLWKLDRRFPSPGKIATDKSAPVPSWSWMAYRGGIDYVKAPFEDIKWVEHALQGPWASGTGDTQYALGGQNATVLKAWARPLASSVEDWTLEDGIKIECDNQDSVKIKGEHLMLVVLATDNECQAVEEVAHLVLVITASREEGRKGYERVGVGYIKDKWLSPKSSEQSVIIR